MNRRGFIATLMGAAAVPMSAKSDAVPEHKVLAPANELNLGVEQQRRLLQYQGLGTVGVGTIVAERE